MHTSNIPELILEIAENGQIQYVNKKYEETLGYRKESLLGLDLENLIHPEDLKPIQDIIQQAEKDEEQLIGISRFRHKDGIFLPFEWKLNSYKDMKGKKKSVLISNLVPKSKKVKQDFVKNLEAMEKNTREANHLLTTILDATPAMVVKLDRNFNFIFVNKAYADSCKLPVSFFPGKNHIELYPNEENQRIFQRVVDTGEPFSVRAKPFKFPDQPERGATYWNWSLVPIKEANGYVRSILFTLEDVTEQVKAEKIIAEAWDLAQKNINELKDAHFEIIQRQFAIDQHAVFAITNKTGIIAYANQRFCEISQYSKEELLGENHRIINSSYHPKDYFRDMYSTLKQGNTWHGEFRNRAKDGSFYWVDATIIPQKTETGKIVEYFSICTDITKRKKIEDNLRAYQVELEAQNQELRERKELHETILETAMDGFWIVENSARLVEVNDTYCKMSGYSKKELLTMSIPDLESMETASETSSHIQKIILQGEDRFETQHRRKDGSIFDVEVSVQYQPYVGGRLVVFLRDITALKKANETVKKHTQELEVLNQTKDKFFNILAHDLRNPFSGILGIAEILDEKMKGDLKNESTQQYFKYIQVIQAAAKSAYALLENLLQWARSQTGSINVRCEPRTIHYLVSKAIPTVNGNAFKKNITIELDMIETDLVFADEFLTNTILRNLLTNAIKFTNHNGKITVSAMKNKGFLEISIADTGVGIDSTALKKIFRIDSKVSKLGTNNETGTGLGLILCKEFVEKQGGKIWATSIVGKGSTFTFSLPLAPA